MDEKTRISEIIRGLSPEGEQLARRVLQLEKESLHIKNPSRITDEIVTFVKGLVK